MRGRTGPLGAPARREQALSPCHPRRVISRYSALIFGGG